MFILCTYSVDLRERGSSKTQVALGIFRYMLVVLVNKISEYSNIHKSRCHQTHDDNSTICSIIICQKISSHLPGCQHYCRYVFMLPLLRHCCGAATGVSQYHNLLLDIKLSQVDNAQPLNALASVKVMRFHRAVRRTARNFLCCEHDVSDLSDLILHFV